MNISELINQLQSLLKERGDIQVLVPTIWHYCSPNLSYVSNKNGECIIINAYREEMK